MSAIPFVSDLCSVDFQWFQYNSSQNFARFQESSMSMTFGFLVYSKNFEEVVWISHEFWFARLHRLCCKILHLQHIMVPRFTFFAEIIVICNDQNAKNFPLLATFVPTRLPQQFRFHFYSPFKSIKNCDRNTSLMLPLLTGIHGISVDVRNEDLKRCRPTTKELRLTFRQSSSQSSDSSMSQWSLQLNKPKTHLAYDLHTCSWINHKLSFLRLCCWTQPGILLLLRKNGKQPDHFSLILKRPNSDFYFENKTVLQFFQNETTSLWIIPFELLPWLSASGFPETFCLETTSSKSRDSRIVIHFSQWPHNSCRRFLFFFGSFRFYIWHMSNPTQQPFQKNGQWGKWQYSQNVYVQKPFK